MDGQSGQGPVAPQQQASLIRLEQVRKLPHLDDVMKQRYEQHVSKLWHIINTQPNTPEQANAYSRLSKISGELMGGMRNWQAQRKAQTQQQTQAAAIAAQQAQNRGMQPGQGSNSSISFAQLSGHTQQQVNNLHFTFPPAMTPGTAEADQWLSEAKARYGQALQRSQVAKQKQTEFMNLARNRQHSGNPLSQGETEQLQHKINQCKKAQAESQSFMDKFNKQQTDFKTQRSQGEASSQFAGAPNSDFQAPQPPPQIASQQNTAGPTAHSITSAVAARNQASAVQSATSPTNQQVQPANPMTANSSMNNQTPTNTAFNQAQNQNNINGHQAPASATAPTRPGIPHALTHQSAISQSSESHAAAQQQASQPQSATHSHPTPNYLNMAKKDDRQPITKNLNVSQPRPVPVPPARPSLSGGANVGMPGAMSQPAIPQMPGYVLETSEDGSILSKKKLNELVREVCGPGPEEQLTPEVEEIFLSVADDFVDELISAACRLAKLRNSTVLEIKDIQLVLERQYNIRVPGFASDEARTVKRMQPAQGWAHKMSAVQAAKLTGGGSTSAVGALNGSKD